MLVRPYNESIAITTSDSENLMPYTVRNRLTDAIYVGTTGDVIAVDQNGDATTFKAVPAGVWLPIAVKRVNASGTTATNLVACYWV